jgi:hypothetical protein
MTSFSFDGDSTEVAEGSRVTGCSFDIIDSPHKNPLTAAACVGPLQPQSFCLRSWMNNY